MGWTLHATVGCLFPGEPFVGPHYLPSSAGSGSYPDKAVGEEEEVGYEAAPQTEEKFAVSAESGKASAASREVKEVVIDAPPGGALAGDITITTRANVQAEHTPEQIRRAPCKMLPASEREKQGKNSERVPSPISLGR